MTWLRLAPYAMCLALAAGIWLHGQAIGRAGAEAAHAAALAALQADLDRVAAGNRAAAAELLAARDAQAALSEALENEARSDVDHCRVPAAGSLRRLERRWQGVGR